MDVSSLSAPNGPAREKTWVPRLQSEWVPDVGRPDGPASEPMFSEFGTE